MPTIAYELDNKVVTETFIELPTVFDFPHILLDSNIPTEPIESWYIEDGEIKIDQQKLIEVNRQTMPNLTKREFRKKLRDAQLFDQVEAYVKASNDGYLQDAWEYADYFARLDPFIVSSCEKLGLSPEQVDSIWVSE